MKNKKASSAIAVVGMACHFPGSRDLKTFWENILARKRQFRPFPDQRLPLSEYYDPDPETPDKTYCSKAAFIDGFKFDWSSHRIPKSSFLSSDITHWLALEVALRSLDDAGFTTKTVPHERSGVILGNTLTGEQSRAEGMRLRWPFVSRMLRDAARAKGLPARKVAELLQTMESYYKSVFAPVTEDTLSGALSNTIAGRICNYLDFHGGGYTVDGACSSSLVAVATAATSLTNGDLDLALAGGVDISLDTFELIGFAKTAALTKTDMRVYDRRASGFLPGEGCGFVVLKRLEDAISDGNYIYGIIRGWGISSDGKGGLTAPSARGQATALQRAYERSGFTPCDLDFIEGHGTGTVIGDKVEVEGISLAMDGVKEVDHRQCGITSLKSIIGHTKAASGIGGFIKAVIALNRRVIPPTANCSEPNQVFESSARMLYPIMTGEIRRPADKLRAGVSAMGFGGINCHVTLESGDVPSTKLAPLLEERKLMVSNQGTELFVLSAPSLPFLLNRARDIRRLAQGISEGEMVDLAASLSREADMNASLRAAIVAGSPDGILESLQYLEKMLEEDPPSEGRKAISPKQDIFVGNAIQKCRVGFLFPGQGSQQLNMTSTIVDRREWARDMVSNAATWLEEMKGMDLSRYIFKSLDKASDQRQIDEWSKMLKQTEIAQPAICLSSLLWVHELNRLGIRPDAVGGHSLGELTAFHVAGAFDERALLKLASLRGELMAAPGDESGIMASLACTWRTATDILSQVSGYAVVANINSPQQVIISGARSSIEQAVNIAGDQGIATQILSVSNAFHSRFVSSAAERLRNSPPIPKILTHTKTKLFSSFEGREIRPGLSLHDHFADHVVSRVDFVSLVNEFALECDMMLEVGPGKVLTNLANRIMSNGGPLCLPIESVPGKDSDLNMFLGNFFVHGGGINWKELYKDRLVRPFVPSSQRIFIENPCERTFNTSYREMPQTTAGDGGVLESLLADEAHISPQLLSDYISRRGQFLGALIKADIQSSEPYMPPANSSRPETEVFSPPVVPDIEEKQNVETENAGSDTISIQNLLLDLIEKRTGFPQESLSMELRLLDDLNLDSIKAAELIAEAATTLGVAGKLNVSQYANASLMDVADILGQLKGEQDESGGTLSATEIQRGFPSWVRNFAIKPVVEKLPDASFDRPSVDWNRENILIISEPDEQDTVQVMRAQFMKQGAQVHTELFQHVLQQGISSKFEYTVFITLLPKNPRRGSMFKSRMLRVIDRLRVMASPPRRPMHDGRKTTIAYIQFGGGYFGTGRNVSDIEQCSAVALAASIHLERRDLRVRVIDFDSGVASVQLAKKVMTELISPESYAAVGYDQALTRRVPKPQLQEPADYLPRSISWSPRDVILVTGGAKGITAECALELARVTKVSMALAGSSPHRVTNSGTEEGGEIENTLKRFSDSGLTARYYQCDITNPDEVKALVKKVRTELGNITGVIHGSALNIPGDVDKVSTDDAFREVSPKVIGAVNLCNALSESPPKLFAGITSIIGVSGMKRNAWYGFSNEALNLIVSRFGAEHPQTTVICTAFSIWDDIGMGVRMGSTAHLARMGIEAIPAREGVLRFMQLIMSDPGEKQVVISARIASLDTFTPDPFTLPESARFLENVVYSYPEVEVVTRSHLTLEKDPYLRDHQWRGTYLFPTVFGLEAMLQAVAYVTGESNFDSLRIEDIRLERPITVNPEHGEEIEIRAEVLEQKHKETVRRVRVGISVEQSGFHVEHFAATFVLNVQSKAPVEYVELPGMPLEIDPERDLYNGKLLFQGPLFQRITRVYVLNSKKCFFRAALKTDIHNPHDVHGKNDCGFWLGGDPYLRDSLLHSAQLPVSRDTCLPLRIESIERYRDDNDVQQSVTGVAIIEDRTEQEIHATVYALNRSGQVVECIKGYVLRIMEHHDDYPTPEELVNPAQNDDIIIRNEIIRRMGHFGLTAPEVTLAHLPGIHQLTKDRRHALEQPLLYETVHRAMADYDDSEEKIHITWLESGKPHIDDVKDTEMDISLSHDESTVMCVAGRGLQGCDIASVTERGHHEWFALLGDSREALFQQLLNRGDAADRAGTRIWAASEALHKASGSPDVVLTIDGQNEDSILFSMDGGTDDIRVLTFPAVFTRGPERMIAVVAHPEKDPVVSAPQTLKSGHTEKLNFDLDSYKAEIKNGPQGQPLFVFQFPVTFKEASNPSRTLYFSHYYAWIGKLREFMVQPIHENLVEWFSTGKWGMVTNHAETRITGEAKSGDIIEGSLWLDKVYGKDDSTLEFCFEWRKVNSHGNRELIAASKMSTTWVAVHGHGIVEVRPLPEFGKEFVKNMIPSTDMGSVQRESDGHIPSLDFGKLLHQEPAGPVTASALLREEIYQTSLEDANLVGNIYFSNYYIWQGRIRDHFLYNIAPEYFRSSGKQGELRCVNCKVNHMHEAMPFDKIVVRMYRTALYDRAIRLYFEYFRLTAEGKRQKLGFGEHDAVWYAPDGNNMWVPSDIPETVRDALLPGGKKDRITSTHLSDAGGNRKYDVIVVGAGIGGLTAGALLAKQGKRVLLIEQHNKHGGFCTSWERHVKRKDNKLAYVFDAGVHDISGLGPKGFVRKILQELGISDRVEWIRMDHEYILPDHHIKVPHNSHDYIDLLIDRFPEEREGIISFFREVKACYHEIYEESSDKKHISRWRNFTFSNMIDTFIGDPRLKKILSVLYVYISDDADKISALTMIPLFGYYIDGGYYPRGGSQAFSDALAGYIKEHGGDIVLNTSVSRILVENKRVIGARLANGKVLYSGTVISNADIRRTFLELVGHEYLPSYLSNRIKRFEPSNSAFMVSLGIDFIPDINPTTLVIEDKKKIGVMVPSKADPSLAPEDHACVTLITLLSHEESSSWNRQAPEYVERKRKLGDELIALAEKAIPHLREHIVYRQDASPATFSRYARTTDGAIYGLSIDEWRPSARTSIAGLYLSGAGIAARPGVESAVYSGIIAVDAIRKEEGRNLRKSPKGVLANALC